MEATDALENVACAICGGTASQPYCAKFGLRIVQCTRCDLIFANPRLHPAELEQRYSAQYFRTEYLPVVLPPGGPHDYAHLDKHYRVPLELLQKRCSKVGRLLEIGSGAGFFLKAAVRAGWDAQDVEFSGEAATYAREELGLRVSQGRVEETPFEAGSFDAVAMFDVIEHLRHPSAVLRAANTCLKPGGALILSTPNIDALSRWALGTDWAVLSPAEHLYYFSEHTLGQLLSNAGFRHVRHVRSGARSRSETMNGAYTHAPKTARAMVYRALVFYLGPFVYRAVRAAGLGDGLLTVASS